MPSITVVAHDIGPFGGQEAAMEDFVLHAKDQGVDVTVIGYRVSEAVRQAASTRVVRKPPGPFLVKFLYFWVVSGRAIRKHSRGAVITCGAISAARPDAVWMHFWHAEHLRSTGWVAAWGGNAARFANQSLARVFALLAEIYTLSFQRPQFLIAVSRSQANSLAVRFPERNVLYLPNPVKVTSLDDSEEREEPHGKSVVFVGGEWARKGLERVAEASARLAQKRGQPIILKIAGKGDPAVISKLSNLPGLQVTYTPWSEDVSSIIRGSDVFALASKYETFAMAGHEALAAGTPVVTTRVHGLAEAVEATGLGCVAAGDIESLSRALESVLFEHVPTPAESERAKTWIDSHFGAASLERKRRDLLEKVAR